MPFMETFHRTWALICHQCLMCTKHRLFPIEQQSGLSLPSLHFYSQKWHLALILTEGHIVWFFFVFLLFTTPPVYQDCFSSICEHLHGAAAASEAVSGWAHECPRTSSEHIDYTDQKASKLSIFIIYRGEDKTEGNEAETLKTCVISRQSSE